MKLQTLFSYVAVLTLVATNYIPVVYSASEEQSPVSSIEVQSTNKQAYKMKVMVGLIGESDYVQAIAQVVEQDLKLPLETQTGFDIVTKKFATEPHSKSAIKNLLKEGYSLVVFLSAKSKDDITYRVYDATNASMVCGKKLVLKDHTITGMGHHLAGLLAQQFLGRPIQFGAQLAFCKLSSGKNNKQLFVTDPHAQQTYQTLVTTESPKFGLRWFTHDNQARLYYSEQSAVNIRLMSYDVEKKRTKLVLNFDGLNMQPSFSEDGSKVVVCCSQVGSSQLYMGTLDPVRKQWVFKRLTYNKGNNISPHLCKNGDVLFCSDFQTRAPQLYRYHQSDGTIERLTDGGYCASPAVLESQGQIAYIKLVNSIAQIFMYNINSKKHTQITFDATHKDEPSWSPCGTYLAYSVERGESSRIAVRNMVSQEAYFVTAAGEQCTSPAWGPGVIC